MLIVDKPAKLASLSNASSGWDLLPQEYPSMCWKHSSGTFVHANAILDVLTSGGHRYFF